MSYTYILGEYNWTTSLNVFDKKHFSQFLNTESQSQAALIVM